MLTNPAYNPDWPDNPSASYTHIYTNFETQLNSGWDNYGERLRAFVVPPMSGDYTFWIASDDTSLFLLSTNESPADEMQVCSVTSWTPWRVFNEEPNQQSAPIYLQAGQRYYLEALHQQGGGGDNLTVQWELPNGVIELPMTTPSAAGTLLIPFTGVDNTPGIYWQPTNTTAIEDGTVAFSVLVTNQASVSYQWHLNATNLPGANSPVITLTNLSLSWSGETFCCVVSNAAGFGHERAGHLDGDPGYQPAGRGSSQQSGHDQRANCLFQAGGGGERRRIWPIMFSPTACR